MDFQYTNVLICHNLLLLLLKNIVLEQKHPIPQSTKMLFQNNSITNIFWGFTLCQVLLGALYMY